MTHRRSFDRGASLVEAAFALPIFFLLVLGLVDFGLVGLNDTQAGNAARDGARVAAIEYLKADESGSPDWNAIKAAIDQNLPGRSVGSDITLEVRCIDVQTGTARDCEHADIDVDVDHINVKVAWDQPFISPVAQALGFDTARVSGDATSVIVGAPIPGGAAGNQPCALSGVTVTPTSVDRYASGSDSGELYEDLEVVVSGAGLCPNLELTLIDASGATATPCTGGCLGTHVFAKDAANFWTAGTATVRVTDGGGESFPVSTTFQVEDDAPPPCVVSAVTVTPNPVMRFKNGPKAGQLKSDVIITVIGAGTCTEVEVTLTTPNSTPVGLCSGSCLGPMVYPKATGNYWTPGTATIVVQNGSNSVSTTFQVQDDPRD